MILDNKKLLKELLKKEKLPKVSNDYYIKIIDVEDETNKANLKTALDSYGEQKWWLSKDVKTRAFGQLFEPILIIPFSDMHEGISKILERPVFRLEFLNTLGRLKTQVMQVVNENLLEEADSKNL